MKELGEGLYKNHATKRRATYDINIERLRSSLGLSTISSFSRFKSFVSQCGPSMRYEKYTSINTFHIYLNSDIKNIFIKYVCWLSRLTDRFQLNKG
jgi:hypothetical protein